MEFYSKYKSHEEEIMKIANEDKNQNFASEITIKEEWNNEEDFEDILSPSFESKGSNQESSTSPLTGFFWLLSHVIYLKLTKVSYECLLSQT